MGDGIVMATGAFIVMLSPTMTIGVERRHVMGDSILLSDGNRHGRRHHDEMTGS